MFRGMRTRTTVVIALSVVIAAVVCWFAVPQPEPRYKGRTLSYWVEMYLDGKNQTQAKEAIQKIGTNAFPLLLQWIREPEPQRHPLLLRVAGMLPRPVRPKWASADYAPRSFVATCAFKALGAQARDVSHELSKIAADPANRKGALMALKALAFMGSNGIPPLLAAISDSSHPYRTGAAYNLCWSEDLGPYTNAVVTELIAQLDDPAVAGQAATTLGFLKVRPDLVVPALGRQLETTNTQAIIRIHAALALIDFMERATSALPALTNALNDPDVEVRKQATNAIDAIIRSAQK